MKDLCIQDKINLISQKVDQIEAKMSDFGGDARQIVQTELKTAWRIPAQANAIPSLHTGICISTIDPLKQGRVRFFSPLLHDKETKVLATHWAWPISNQGGFDDCGCTWVPPAGSKICILFEAGNRDWAYYIGTTWDRDRTKKWGQTVIQEYEKIHEGHRGGYLVGPNETQVFPPWNTENYNGFDMDSDLDFEQEEDAEKKLTYPNIYGWKTPQKHMIKLVDGNYKCNFRWQRMEFKSAQGNHLIFKDDKLHPAAQWAHPSCGCGGGDASVCHDENDEPIEKADTCPVNADKSSCANKYFKHASECRPYGGPGNAQNNKVDKTTLPQSGIQLTSLSGHTFWMDDSVRLPKGSNKWENGLASFDYGCSDDPTYIGRTSWKSAHGHQIYMCDEEHSKEPGGRTNENLIKIMTATGNRIELNDDTIPKICKAGPKRGITMQSTSNHTIEMIDENNEQCNKNRREGSQPKNEAKNAFVKIRSGYGLEIKMADDNSQKKTEKQSITIMAPQYDACAGPHLIKLQEDKNCGYIFIRAAGDYVNMCEGDSFSAVGVGKDTPSDDFCAGGCLGPRDWFLCVSRHSIHYSCKFYFNKAESHVFYADRLILLLAGKDCPGPVEPGPCVGPIAVLSADGKLRLSSRVFASYRPQDSIASIFMLSPFAKDN